MYRKLFYSLAITSTAYLTLTNAKKNSKNQHNKSYKQAVYEINTDINTLEDLKAHNENFETTFMIYYTDSNFISSAQGPLCVNYEDGKDEDPDSPCYTG